MSAADAGPEELLGAAPFPARRARAPAGSPRRPPGEDAPLSFAQRRLWFLDRLVPGNAAYRASAAFRLRGPSTSPASSSACGPWRRGTRSCGRSSSRARAASRGSAASRAGRVPPRGRIGRRPPPPPIRWRPPGRPRPRRPRGPSTWSAGRSPAPACCGWARRSTPSSARCTIISDGWSTGVFIREIGAHYAALAAGRGDPLPPLALQYADHAAWQRSSAERGGDGGLGAMLVEGAPGWPARARAAGRFCAAGGPGLSRREHVADRAGGARRARPLAALARREETTLFVVTLAAFQAALAAWSGQRDFAGRGARRGALARWEFGGR